MNTAKVIELPVQHSRGKFSITAVVRFKHGELWNYLKSRRLTPKEYAGELGVHVNTVYAWLNMRRIPNRRNQDSIPAGCFPAPYVKAVRNKDLNYGTVEVTRTITIPSVGIRVQFNTTKKAIAKGGD